jgi:hypothetical protein
MKTESIPLSISLSGFYRKALARRKMPVDRRVFYLSIQVILNAMVIGVVAKGLVYLIDGITNLAFYGRLSLAPGGPAGNHLGLAVILVPIVGAVVVGLMARFGSKAIGGHGIPEAMEKIILDESRIPPAAKGAGLSVAGADAAHHGEGKADLTDVPEICGCCDLVRARSVFSGLFPCRCLFQGPA